MLKVIFFLTLLCTPLSLKCKKESDCEQYNSCEGGKCEHKDIFPLKSLEILGTFLLLFLGLLSSAGGVGGGIISTSFSLLLFKFDAHMAIALTQIFAFAASITPIVIKFKSRHPKVDRPLIYYDLIMQIASPLLLGVSIGVLFNPSIPAWLILAILTILLIYVTIDINRMGIRLYKKETMMKKTKTTKIEPSEPRIEAKNEVVELNKDKASEKAGEKNGEDEKNLGDQGEGETGGVIDTEKGQEAKLYEKNEENLGKTIINTTEIGEIRPIELANETNDPKEQELARKLEEIIKADKQTIHWTHISYFLFLIVFSTILSLLRGGSKGNSIAGFKTCSGGYYGMIVVYIVVMVILAVITSFYLINKTKICQKGKFKFDEGDVLWTPRMCIIVFVIGFLIGFLVGILGLGSGFIIGPILIHLGVRPEVSTISSSLIICISSVTASIQYIAFKIIAWDYSLWYAFIAVLGAAIGTLWLRQFAIKRGRPSLLILILGFVSLVAMIVIPYVGISGAIKQSNDGTFQLGFGSLC